MTSIADAFPAPDQAAEASEGGSTGRAVDTSTGLHVHAREIIALTDSDGKRASRPRRMEHFRQWVETRSGPVDGWAFSAQRFADIRAFVQRVPAEREVEAWRLVVDHLDAMADALGARFGDVRGSR